MVRRVICRDIKASYDANHDRVKDMVEGTLYHQDLQLVQVNTFYTVERLLKKRTLGNKFEYSVKWKSYGDKFNTWIIKEDDIA